MSWQDTTFELRVDNPAHGGFVVGRHEGRVVFVRGALPGETVRVRVTEDRGGSFCRAEVFEVLDGAADRIAPLCRAGAELGAGCCDLSHATLAAQRRIKAFVVAEQLSRLAGMTREVEVEELPGTGDGTGWRTRVRLVADKRGRAGTHRYRGSAIVTELVCPQPVSGMYDGISAQRWAPGSDLVVAVDGDGTRHLVQVEPAQVSATGRRGGGRRGAMARRSATSAARAEIAVLGGGRAREHVAGRTWELAATGFWQAHRAAAQTYSDIVAGWTRPGAVAWDLYSGVGVFAARLAESSDTVAAVESSAPAVADGERALTGLPVRFYAGRVEQTVAALPAHPHVVVLDPPRAGAGKEVVAAVCAQRPDRIVHIGCDPAAFARDVALYRGGGYGLAELRAFDAFPLTHHVECLALLVRI